MLEWSILARLLRDYRLLPEFAPLDNFVGYDKAEKAITGPAGKEITLWHFLMLTCGKESDTSTSELTAWRTRRDETRRELVIEEALKRGI